jgi:hypothetical protein
MDMNEICSDWIFIPIIMVIVLFLWFVNRPVRFEEGLDGGVQLKPMFKKTEQAQKLNTSWKLLETYYFDGVFSLSRSDQVWYFTQLELAEVNGAISAKYRAENDLCCDPSEPPRVWLDAWLDQNRPKAVIRRGWEW